MEFCWAADVLRHWRGGLTVDQIAELNSVLVKYEQLDVFIMLFYLPVSCSITRYLCFAIYFSAIILILHL